MKGLFIALISVNSIVAIGTLIYLYFLMKDIAKKNEIEEINFNLSLTREKRVLTVWQIGDFYFCLFTIVTSISFVVALSAMLWRGM